MAKLTRVYAIGYTELQGRKDINFSRFDPRVDGRDTSRTYKRFTEASAVRVGRLLSGDNVRIVLFPDRMRISRQFGRSRLDWKFGKVALRWIRYGCE